MTAPINDMVAPQKLGDILKSSAAVVPGRNGRAHRGSSRRKAALSLPQSRSGSLLAGSGRNLGYKIPLNHCYRLVSRGAHNS
jgi:hypothetical protein